ncbi:GNAT family N-acetyltransferase [Flavihumibacter profundi]|uniref:GNAT family N-acetyltransferase n=1 Tax=Flavihumibacter profundi TaxID=2716883 RepID=UPI001CC565A9|nr:GNAT family N-acetyltransferase [Flavihumibacter profundi]MBZ5856360.1 GNAT family N-acetyltransferase [Flavihumibacter profundi]
MSETLVIRSADQDDISTIGYLAHQVWPVTYNEILSSEQMDYMLRLFYSPGSLEQQISEFQHHFIIAEIDLEEVGFASFNQVDEATWKLQKLYVLPEVQGKGVGKALMDMVEEEVRIHNGAHLILNVNKFNKSIRFYEAMGFTIEKEEVIDIGNGFIMDDYVLGKDV